MHQYHSVSLDNHTAVNMFFVCFTENLNIIKIPVLSMLLGWLQKSQTIYKLYKINQNYMNGWISQEVSQKLCCLYIYIYNLGELTLYCLRVPNICSLCHSEADFFSYSTFFIFTYFPWESKITSLKIYWYWLKAALINIWPLGSSRISCQHDTEVLSSYRFIMAEH